MKGCSGSVSDVEEEVFRFWGPGVGVLVRVGGRWKADVREGCSLAFD